MGFFDDILNPAKSANAAVATGQKQLKKGYQAVNSLYEPYRVGGNAAFNQQSNLLGLNGAQAQQAGFDSFRTDPGYQFKLNQGIGAIDASAASRGLLGSGGTQKALMEYGQGLADQGYNDFYNRLGGLGNTGANTAAAQAAARMQTATGVAQGYGQMGANTANQSLGYMGLAGNALNGFLGK